MSSIFAQMNGFDYTLLIIALLSLLIGLKRGLLREMFSLVIWVAAFVVAILFTTLLAAQLSGYIKTAWIAEFVAFALLLVAVLIIGRIVGLLICAAIDGGRGGFFDHLMGGFFGLLRGGVIACLVVFLISHTYWEESSWFQQSQVSQRILEVTHWSYHNVLQHQSEYESKKAQR